MLNMQHNRLFTTGADSEIEFRSQKQPKHNDN